jgi:alcohol dehydrogenase, propanol-preferring
LRAVVFSGVGLPLEVIDRPPPALGPRELRLRVHACGVCRTDVHIVDGELAKPTLPVVLGHQIVGTVVERGERAERFALGRRVGVPWLGWTCGTCSYCRDGRENLCLAARFTGYTIDGGFAEETVADERFCVSVPYGYADAEAAPLLCAGLIGYRALRLAGDPERLGLYGFGAAAHLVCQVAVQEGREVFAFTRPGDERGQEFARSLGAVWAGDSTGPPPDEMHAAIVFASAGELVPLALGALARGGSVVCAGIHMSDIPSFPYELLWQERILRSVANLTRRDGDEFMEVAARLRVRPEVTVLPLESAEEAVAAVRSGSGRGAVVLTV